MAKNVTGNPLILDTAETVYATGGRECRIKAIKYIGTGDEASCILQDGAAREIWRGKLGDVSVDGYQDSDYFGDRGFISDGLIVATIDNGIVLVYLAGVR